jgi:hypothetical protein
MHGVFLVPNKRRDILWLNSRFEMNHTTWNDVVGHWQNPPLTSTSDAPLVGAYTDLGGIFASPPVAVETDGNHLHVFGLGTDYAVYRKSFDATNPSPAAQWTPNWERIGGNFMCTPVVVSTGPSRIDLFGLDIDQSMVHSTWNGTSWSAWDELGGCFSGTPIVLPTIDGKFDIFARAIDYKLYHLAYDPAVQTDWKILGGGLLGEPVAASAPAAVRVQQRIFVFVVGDDGAMWTTFFDGKLWKPWASLGILALGSAKGNVPSTTFTTEPVAIWSDPAPPVIFENSANQLSQTESTHSSAHAFGGPIAPPPASSAPVAGAFAGRIDLFGVGTDAALWHIWLDPSGWQKSWENLGGDYVCAPSIMGALPSPIVGVPLQSLQFSLLEPGDNSVTKLRTFNGTTWADAWPVGPIFSQPNAFSIGVTEVDIAALRSNGRLGEKDTDNGTANLTVGRWPMLTAYMDMGDVVTGNHAQDFGMSLNRVSVELAEPFIYFYVILNKSITDTTTENIVAQAIAKAAEDFLADLLKQQLNPATNLTILGLDTGIVLDAGGGPFLIASVAAAVIAEGLDLVLSDIFANCDGMVASGTISFKNGRALQQQVRNAAAHKLVGSIHSPGTDSNAGCGGNSDYTVKYEVFWMGL